jgi:hypothetical protein
VMKLFHPRSVRVTVVSQGSSLSASFWNILILQGSVNPVEFVH